MKQTSKSARDDTERLAEKIAECLAEAERLGLGLAAIDLDMALEKVRRSPSEVNH
jgi:hypothetical protein